MTDEEVPKQDLGHVVRVVRPDLDALNGVDKETIRDLYDSGTIPEDNVSPALLESMLKGVEKGTFKVWTDSGFDPSSPPRTNAGISICYDCGEMYWVTPTRDAFGIPEKGRVCDPCMLIEMAARSQDYKQKGE